MITPLLGRSEPRYMRRKKHSYLLRPSLISDLFTAIDQGFSTCYGSAPVEGPPLLRLKRGLQVLNAILKEFAGVKMPSGTKTLSMVG